MTGILFYMIPVIFLFSALNFSNFFLNIQFLLSASIGLNFAAFLAG